jgi:hypothetical protein
MSDLSDLMLTFIPLKNFDLLYRRVGAGAGKFFCQSRIKMMYLAPQHWSIVINVSE